MKRWTAIGIVIPRLGYYYEELGYDDSVEKAIVIW